MARGARGKTWRQLRQGWRRCAKMMEMMTVCMLDATAYKHMHREFYFTKMPNTCRSYLFIKDTGACGIWECFDMGLEADGDAEVEHVHAEMLCVQDGLDGEDGAACSVHTDAATSLAPHHIASPHPREGAGASGAGASGAGASGAPQATAAIGSSKWGGGKRGQGQGYGRWHVGRWHVLEQPYGQRLVFEHYRPPLQGRWRRQLRFSIRPLSRNYGKYAARLLSRASNRRAPGRRGGWESCSRRRNRFNGCFNANHRHLCMATEAAWWERTSDASASNPISNS
eukprot:06184_4